MQIFSLVCHLAKIAVFNDAVIVMLSPLRQYSSCTSLSQRAVDMSTQSGPSVYLSDIVWKEKQVKDPIISRIGQILSSGHKPTRRLCALESESVRKYLREWSNLFTKAVLYRHGYVSGYAVDQLVLLEPFVDIVILIHSSFPLELVCVDFLTLKMSASGF